MAEEEFVIDYGDLAINEGFVNKTEDLKTSLVELNNLLEYCKEMRKQYDTLSEYDKVELDLFTAFASNSLFWVHLRVQGVDLTSHPITHELERVKNAMTRWGRLKDRVKRPKVDRDAAKRFIRSGLWNPKEHGEPTNKKIKFDDK